MLKSVFFALLGATSVVSAASELRFDAPDIIENDVAVPVELTLAGPDLSGQIENVKTVLYIPGKRSPKFFANFTHSEFETSDDLKTIWTSATYSLPTKTYMLGYSVEINDGEESAWIDSDLVEVVVKDHPSSLIHILLSVVGATLFIYGFKILVENVCPPGYLENTLPKPLHFVLSKKNKSKSQ